MLDALCERNADTPFAVMALFCAYISDNTNFTSQAQHFATALQIGFDDAVWRLFLSLRAIGRAGYCDLFAINVLACANGFKLFVSLPPDDKSPGRIFEMNPNGVRSLHIIITGGKLSAHATRVSREEFLVHTASYVDEKDRISWIDWRVGHKSDGAGGTKGAAEGPSRNLRSGLLASKCSFYDFCHVASRLVTHYIFLLQS